MVAAAARAPEEEEEKRVRGGAGPDLRSPRPPPRAAWPPSPPAPTAPRPARPSSCPRAPAAGPGPGAPRRASPRPLSPCPSVQSPAPRPWPDVTLHRLRPDSPGPLTVLPLDSPCPASSTCRPRAGSPGLSHAPFLPLSLQLPPSPSLAVPPRPLSGWAGSAGVPSPPQGPARPGCGARGRLPCCRVAVGGFPRSAFPLDGGAPSTCPLLSLLRSAWGFTPRLLGRLPLPAGGPWGSPGCRLIGTDVPPPGMDVPTPGRSRHLLRPGT